MTVTAAPGRCGALRPTYSRISHTVTRTVTATTAPTSPSTPTIVTRHLTTGTPATGPPRLRAAPPDRQARTAAVAG
ncbi:hypothetical protein Aru02nite_72440 [Actinocatenispora rupis]|uniref:Uncharacterized protein n=1 Tax=Actinocatenispora rupis TaxID=519421 RepID=A0A8J3NGV1_9ACTN|nr:hypothetical protein Aru02nite_72440 [Actinocatenispora rupis]